LLIIAKINFQQEKTVFLNHKNILLVPAKHKKLPICKVKLWQKFRAPWCVEKADLRKGYQNPKRKLGVTKHFSEIIQLKFGKKLPYILCILDFF